MANEVKTTVLPSMEHTFTVLNLKGTETGKIYNGTFTYRRLTLGSRALVANMQARLQEDLTSLPEDVRLLNEMLSYLRYGLTVVADFWKESNYGLNLYDANVVAHLWMECQKFERHWEKQVYGDDESVKLDNNPAEPQVAQTK